MLKKMLIMSVFMVCFFNNLSADEEISIAKINEKYPSVPYRNRLFILESQVRDRYKVSLEESTTKADEKKLIDSIYKEGISSLSKRKDSKTAEVLLELLYITSDIFHFSSRFEAGEFSMDEYIDREKEICSYSKERAEDLDAQITLFNSSEESSL